MSAVAEALRRTLPAHQVITDELRRLAYGTDASFYRLIPEVIAVVESENDLKSVLTAARASRRPVTFRAAGTSLSGQAITDRRAGPDRRGLCHLRDCGRCRHRSASEPGIIGGEVNRRLAPHGRKIGPDPASINACKIGGIAANNASGMCCGTAQNSYRTVAGMRVMLADGTLLDTEDPPALPPFCPSHAALLDELERTRRRDRAPTAPWPSASATSTRSRTPPATASTRWSTYGPDRHPDPPDDRFRGHARLHSRITYHTVVGDPFKASALVFFPDIRSACERSSPQAAGGVGGRAARPVGPALGGGQARHAGHIRKPG